MASERLLVCTAVFLAIYIPGETYISLPDLLSPFYLVDVAGMALLSAGLLRRRTPMSSPLLVAGYAWTGANVWRAMADRLRMAALNQNGWTEADSTRIALVGGVLILLACAAMFAALRSASERPVQPAAAVTDR
jgi:hypothetical protein